MIAAIFKALYRRAAVRNAGTAIQRLQVYDQPGRPDNGPDNGNEVPGVELG
jgi:hypothetical protein